jgi:hypothetical protein
MRVPVPHIIDKVAFGTKSMTVSFNITSNIDILLDPEVISTSAIGGGPVF